MSGQTWISFSGLDGAGKSHQIDAVMRELAEQTEVALLWVPYKNWPEGLLERLLPAGLRSRLGPSRPAVSAAAAGAAPTKPRSLLARLLRTLLWTPVGCLAAVSTGLSLRSRAAAADKAVVVLDRYRLDSIVKLHYWYAEVPPRLLSAIVLAIAPRPALELLLRVPAEEAYARKPEQWSVRQLRRQAASYDAAAAHARAVVVDGVRPVDEVTAEVLRHVRTIVGESPRV